MAVSYYPQTGTIRQVRFIYAVSTMKDFIEEVNQRTIKLMQTEKGAPLIDEYALDFDNSPLAQECLEKAVNDTAQIIRDIRPLTDAPDIFTTVDGVESIVFTLRYSSFYHDDDISAMDIDLPDMIVSKALIAWYAAHDNNVLSERAKLNEKDSLGRMMPLWRNMFRDANRKVLRNPFSVN